LFFAKRAGERCAHFDMPAGDALFEEGPHLVLENRELVTALEMEIEPTMVYRAQTDSEFSLTRRTMLGCKSRHAADCASG
jgi:hypothetical protein